MASFDGLNKIITLDSGVIDVDAIDIYSEWKEWVIVGTNSAVEAAFRVSGGDDIDIVKGITAGSYFFLQTQYGWRIRPPEEDIRININGNIYPEESGVAIDIDTIGDFNTGIRLSTSSLTETVTIVSGSGVTEQDKADIAVLVWQQVLSNFTIVGTAGWALNFIRKLASNKVRISGDTFPAVTTIYDDDKLTPIHTLDHSDKLNRDPR